MRNIVVADSHCHALAVIHWLKLDPEIWFPVRYGQKIQGDVDSVKLVRPASGASDEHLDWVMDKLSPLVRSPILPIPECWGLNFHEDEFIPAATTYQKTMWT